MPSVLQINTVVNTGSTGRIAEDIGNIVIQNGWTSYIAYGRKVNYSSSNLLKIGNKLSMTIHGLRTRLFDSHGFGSSKATWSLIKNIDQIKPDIIHLHNLHGYYLNIQILFNYLSKTNRPIIWTLHDCWAFTGHCTYFDFIGCEKWETQCHHCPQKKTYPASLLLDRSQNNYLLKREIFNSVDNLTVVPVSNWLRNLVSKSFLAGLSIKVINNGLDVSVFKLKEVLDLKRKLGFNNKFIILGIADGWSPRKGFLDFVKLSETLNNDYIVVLVGLKRNQIKHLPKRVVGLKKTSSKSELVDFYNLADVFVNPTWEDNFPTTNLEAMACGTPVITYNTGGSPEAVNDKTGFVVNQGDINGLLVAINTVKLLGKKHFSPACRERALKLYDKNDRYNDYLLLYKSLLEQNKSN